MLELMENARFNSHRENTRSTNLGSLTINVCGDNLHTPPQTINEVHNLINDFVWKGGRPKVRLEVMALPTNLWGLKLPIYQNQVKSLKLCYVKRLFDDEQKAWKDCLQVYFPNVHIKHIFLSRCCIPITMKKNIPLFYMDIMSFWEQLKDKYYPSTAEDIAEEYLWFNPHNRIAGETVFFHKWYKKGIKTIKHIIGEHNELLSDEEIKNRYDLHFHFLEYYSLRQAIPFSWKRVL
jgi:hypothetical protein